MKELNQKGTRCPQVKPLTNVFVWILRFFSKVVLLKNACGWPFLSFKSYFKVLHSTHWGFFCWEADIFWYTNGVDQHRCQRRIQNPVKHWSSSFLRKTTWNGQLFFYKELHLRCFIGFCIHFYWLHLLSTFFNRN